MAKYVNIYQDLDTIVYICLDLDTYYIHLDLDTYYIHLDPKIWRILSFSPDIW